MSLAPVQGPVGEVDELGRVLGDGAVADARRDRHAVGPRGGLGDQPPSSLHGDQRLLARRLGQDPRELVSPHPPQRVLGAGEVAQAAGHPYQHLIPYLVTTDVVDVLEVVDVDDRHGERPGVPHRAGDLGGQPLLQSAMVGQPGKRIAGCLGG